MPSRRKAAAALYGTHSKENVEKIFMIFAGGCVKVEMTGAVAAPFKHELDLGVV